MNSLCIWLSYSDLVFIFYFLSCYLIWAPHEARTSSGWLVLQMEPFCSTCWLTYPKLTEHFSLQKKCTRTYNGVISIIEAILDKIQGCLLIDLLVSFCVSSSYNLPYASSCDPTKVHPVVTGMITGNQIWILGIKCETLQENKSFC